MSKDGDSKEYSEEDLKNMSAEEIAELQKQNCIFCKIAEKQIPAKIIHEDSNAICILDINPASEGHILIYPKKHYMILPHIPDDTLSKVFSDVKLMSHTLLKTLQCKGTTVFIANGVAAGQKAPHAIIHVFPRRENDGLVKLPDYDMSTDQISSLHQKLEPYINKMFKDGKSRTSVKSKNSVSNIIDANFSDSKDEAKTQPEEDSADTTPIHPPKSNSKINTSKNNNIDLDDIAKLFDK